MKKVFLAGFTPFGGFASNSGQEAIKMIISKQRKRLGSFEVSREIFPAAIVPWNRGLSLIETAIYKKASAIVIISMDPGISAISVQTTVRNLVFDRFCDSELNNRPVSPEDEIGKFYPLVLRSWNIEQFQSEMKNRGIRVTLSNRPDGFCGNAVAYQVNSEFSRRKKDPMRRTTALPWIYLRTPCVPEPNRRSKQPTLETEKLIEALRVLLENADIPEAVQIQEQYVDPLSLIS